MVETREIERILLSSHYENIVLIFKIYFFMIENYFEQQYYILR